ncbi:unnamed protein product [Diatraea saccharalis]|uniref:Uncharacterized protein n=1 Tax=Diatraea saccharalis TaxID=40085 RepID=A0A9N9QV56_9NEOP|nr:unnamed protein product [Diatraea saccharalis]
MKVAIFVSTFSAAVLVVAGAPAINNGAEENIMFMPQPQYRGRRSQYGPAYAAPCGGALPALVPAGGFAAGPIHGGFGYGGSGIGFGGGHGYPYSPHYRTEDVENMNLSDMEQGTSEHVPMARYGGYGAAPVIHGGAGLGGLSGLGGQLAAGVGVASGPAYGVFPNANIGGCNVPLLLSCSPSIVPGRLVKSYGGYGAAVPVGAALPVGAGVSGASATVIGNSYRGAEEPNLEHEEAVEEHTNEHLEPAEDNTHSK